MRKILIKMNKTSVLSEKVTNRPARYRTYIIMSLFEL